MIKPFWNIVKLILNARFTGFISFGELGISFIFLDTLSDHYYHPVVKIISERRV